VLVKSGSKALLKVDVLLGVFIGKTRRLHHHQNQNRR